MLIYAKIPNQWKVEMTRENKWMSTYTGLTVLEVVAWVTSLLGLPE